MLLSQNQKLADDLIVTLTTKHYNKEVFYVLAFHSTKDRDVRLALFLYHTYHGSNICWCDSQIVLFYGLYERLKKPRRTNNQN